MVLKGNIPWNKGKKEVRTKVIDKLRKSHLGQSRKHLEETKRKMSIASKGKSKSEKHRLNISLANKGRKPWNYIDGRSKKEGIDRYGSDWKRIRQCIFIRDNFTCQFCGKSKCLLNAHHKIPFRLSRDNSTENLITLCSICHRKEEVRIIREIKDMENYFGN